MGINLETNTRHFIQQLGRKGSKLQVVAAEAINEAAQELDQNYKGRLKRKQKIRSKFTLNSTKTFKARAIRKSGEPRPLKNINAITGVRKMKGGKEHYLAKLEKGRIQRGNTQTRGRVPIPLTTARTGQRETKPIAVPNRLLKGDTQTLRVGGKAFGVRGDRFKTPRQRFAVLYQYRRQASRGLTGDLSKPFFFTDNSNRLGIFKFIRGTARKIRNLEQTTAKTKASPNFKRTVDQMKPASIQEKFVKLAKRALGR